LHSVPIVRVLIVDDEMNQRRSLAIGLRLEGFEVAEAADGEEALAFFESGGTAEVAILDLMMPGINGLELARRLRRAVPHVRVVLTSAYHLSERQIARADVGAVGFVPKPYHLDELAEFLRRKQAVAS
tara:strand:- start:2767 stop:3150 length:384 start_codon:yes stop_codon:yes gene_type:complete